MRAAAALVVLSVFLPAYASAQAAERCFPETGFCISGPIRAYWEQNGGLPVFGYPLGAQREELAEGRSIQVQWFERDRLEIQADGAITAGRLGARLYPERRTRRVGNNSMRNRLTDAAPLAARARDGYC